MPSSVQPHLSVVVLSTLFMQDFVVKEKDSEPWRIAAQLEVMGSSSTQANSGVY